MNVWLTNLLGYQEYEMEKGQSLQKYGGVKTENNLPNNSTEPSSNTVHKNQLKNSKWIKDLTCKTCNCEAPIRKHMGNFLKHWSW